MKIMHVLVLAGLLIERVNFAVSLEAVVPQTYVTNGLVGWWRFDEGSGALAGDYSGQENNGILVNMEESDWVAGHVGTALDLDGSGPEHINVGNDSSLNPTREISMVAWIKPRTYGSSVATIVEKEYLTSYLWYLNGASEDMIVNISGLDAESDLLAINRNVWQHVAFTYDGSSVRFYVNALPAGVSPMTGAIGTDSTNVSIGNDKTLSSSFDGLIDDVRIYNRALTSAEIRAVMNNTPVEPDPPIATVTPTQPTYSPPPVKKPGKENLIVVTHGRIRKLSDQMSPSIANWVDEMTNAITAYLNTNGLTTWQVHAHKWPDRAWTTLQETITGTLLHNASDEGNNLGIHLGLARWNHIHFIGHSAGCALNQAALEKMVSFRESLPIPEIHTTFLDPYVGWWKYDGAKKLGMYSDWSDHYFAVDNETFDPLTSRTASLLEQAHNIEVTYIDPNRVPVTVTYSTPSGDVSKICYQVKSSHEWPHEFYLKSISQNPPAEYLGYGFHLSKEAGRWENLPSQFPTKNNGSETKILGSSDLVCNTPDSILTVTTVTKPDFTVADFIKSRTGEIIIHGINSINMTTASPIWCSVPIQTDKPVNIISFEAMFTGDSNVQGLLTIYWDTNQIGHIDQRVVVPGTHEYSFGLPNTVNKNSHSLGFRLDRFSEIQSTILITNVSIGFLGLPQEFSLSFIQKENDETLLFELVGPKDHVYLAEVSTNLISWETVSILVNTNGTVRFQGISPKNSSYQFYRASVR